MAHQRKLIREAVRALLVDATAAGSRVLTTRVIPWRAKELPGISVFTLEESVDGESATTAPRELTRTVELEIAGYVPGDDADDAMDDLAEQIEAAMDADPTLGGTAVDSILTGTSTALQAEGDSYLGLVELTYAVTYRTDAPAPADLADFRGADVKYQQPGSHPDDAPRDSLYIPEPTP